MSTAARLLAAGLMFYALGQDPYRFYVLLRWITAPIAGYSAFTAFRSGRQGWTWTFGTVAVIFNPFWSPGLDRDGWRIVNVLAGSIFLSSSLYELVEARRRVARSDASPPAPPKRSPLPSIPTDAEIRAGEYFQTVLQQTRATAARGDHASAVNYLRQAVLASKARGEERWIRILASRLWQERLVIESAAAYIEAAEVAAAGGFHLRSLASLGIAGRLDASRSREVDLLRADLYDRAGLPDKAGDLRRSLGLTTRPSAP